MGVFTIELVLAGLPATIFADVRTALRVVEEEVWRATEVLLTMCIVALAPVVNCRVVNWAERCLVGIQHELVIAKNML